MKVSVSLAEEDVAFLDHYAATRGVASRSAALQRAVALLRSHELSDSYAQAWEEWTDDADAEAWEATSADGLDPR